MRNLCQLIVPLVLLVLFAAPGLNAAEHTKDSLAVVKKNLKAGKAVLIDVREVSEWKQGHLKAATLVPLSQIRSADRELIEEKIPTDKIVYLHCRSGARVLSASPILKKYGYDIRPLKQGYKTLLSNSFEKAK